MTLHSNKFLVVTSLVIASALLASCQTLKEVDKALYTMTSKLASQDRVTGDFVLNLTDRGKQVEVGDAAAKERIASYTSKNRPINEEVNEEAYRRIQRIFEDIHKVSHFSHEEWKLVLLPDRKFNAFVMGGRHVFVNIGLLTHAKTDDEIASVLGHEMAHVVANHRFERDASMKASTLSGSKSVSSDGYRQSFTSIDEQEADRIGVVYASLAGYDPFAASILWGKMAAQSSNQWKYFRTHPASDDRAKQTRSYATAVSSYYREGQINPNHKKLIQCNKLWCSKQSKLAAGEGGGLTAMLKTASSAVLRHQKAKTEKARQQAKIAKNRTQQAYQKSKPQQTASTGQSAKFIGQVSFQGGQRLPVRTAFIKRGQNISGRYQVKYHSRIIDGTLKQIRREANNRYAFRWNDETGSGVLLVSFADKGSAFEGVWKFDQNRSGTGRWTGQSVR